MTFSELNYAMNWMGNYIEFANKQNSGKIISMYNTDVIGKTIQDLYRQRRKAKTQEQIDHINKQIDYWKKEGEKLKRMNAANLQVVADKRQPKKEVVTGRSRSGGLIDKLKIERNYKDLQSKYDSLKLNRDTLGTIAGKLQKRADANKRESGRFRKIASKYRDEARANLKSKKFWKKVGIGAGVIGGLGTLGMGALAIRNARRYNNLQNAMGQTWGGRRALRKAGY